MELDQFISESIQQITKGLLTAQEKVSQYGVDIRTNGASGGYTDIDFDVAVTTKNTKDLGGEARLSVLGIDLKAGKSGDKSNTVASRIKFSVEFSIPEEQMKLAAKTGKDASKLT